MNYIVEELHLGNSEELGKLKEFLKEFHLSFDEDIDYSVAIWKNEKIVATCSKAKAVIKGFAVDKSMQSEGITSLLLKKIEDKIFDEGIYHSFIFTKPEYEIVFSSLNFKVISKNKNVVLLEKGFSGIDKYIKKVIDENRLSKDVKRGAIVMNCNPFTLGHRYLIEEGAKECEELLIFLLKEDKSLFSYSERMRLVKEGVKDLENVKVISGGDYIISQATFPSYFLRTKDERLKAYTELDAKIFLEYFCKKLNIVRRYLGEEPYCEVTRAYNDSLEKLLISGGVEVKIIKRKENRDGFISASKVRESIKRNKGINEIELKELLPEVSLNYLKSKEGEAVIEKIIISNTAH